MESPFDHPIFSESIALIRALLAERAAADPALAALLAGWDPLAREVLERCIHSSGDPAISSQLRFSPGACAAGVAALRAGAPILTDTAMAAAAVAPMAGRTFANRVVCALEWAPAQAPAGSTRAAAGMAAALADLQPASGGRAEPAPVVLIGSAPTALEELLARVAAPAPGGALPAPALVIGMPVGFVGVEQSKRRLAASGLVHIRLEGSKGGAGLVAAACNALLRAGWLQAASAPSPAPGSPLPGSG
ncbi:precorrin-8X methylmutase [Cyanobium sp. ATX 6A2]|uniref:precorrin-8X methylmutase n=1 Tax=Cyanobium sp. ATX 6A2 TaxID=2823700 RepID=UPI0020CFD684|nr:precorrin-8X methylmutase [Cyanobium sp. ATX 6A2]